MTDAELSQVIAEVTRDIRLAFAIAFWPPDVVEIFEREGALRMRAGGGVLEVPCRALRMAENAGFKLLRSR